MRAVLLWLDGAGQVRQEFPLEEGVLRYDLGKGDAATIRISAPGVDRRHARIERVQGTWVLRGDTHTTNGTYVNGHRVVDDRMLNDGDLLMLGDDSAQLRVRVLPMVRGNIPAFGSAPVMPPIPLTPPIAPSTGAPQASAWSPLVQVRAPDCVVARLPEVDFELDFTGVPMMPMCFVDGIYLRASGPPGGMLTFSICPLPVALEPGALEGWFFRHLGAPKGATRGPFHTALVAHQSCPTFSVASPGYRGTELHGLIAVPSIHPVALVLSLEVGVHSVPDAVTLVTRFEFAKLLASFRLLSRDCSSTI